MNTPVDPMTIQYGGNHYKHLVIQPTEFCMRNGLDPCIHGALKYIVRWRDKGGVEDLRKAVHYIQIREKFADDRRPQPVVVNMVEFVHKNGICDPEAEAVYRLEAYYRAAEGRRVGAAARAIEAIEAIIRAEELKPA